MPREGRLMLAGGFNPRSSKVASREFSKKVNGPACEVLNLSCEAKDQTEADGPVHQRGE